VYSQRKTVKLNKDEQLAKTMKLIVFSSFLTIVIFHCCVTRFSYCKILYREVTGVM
jgi:hypothetical protein